MKKTVSQIMSSEKPGCIEDSSQTRVSWASVTKFIKNIHYEKVGYEHFYYKGENMARAITFIKPLLRYVQSLVHSARHCESRIDETSSYLTKTNDLYKN